MAVLAVATSCNKATTKTPSVEKTSGESLTISVGGGNKSIYSNGAVKWSSSDHLCVFNDGDEGSDFTTSQAYSGQTEATFTCDNWAGGTPVIATHTYSTSACICTSEAGKKVSLRRNASCSLA